MEKILRESLMNEIINDRITDKELSLPDSDTLTELLADTKCKWYELGFKKAVDLLKNGTLKI